MSDYLSARKRKQVEEMKRRIREGEVVSYQVTVYDIIANAIYEDEQGPWSLEDPYTEWEIATYELALEAHDREVAAGALRDASKEWPLIIRDGVSRGSVRAWLETRADQIEDET